ncbi:MAG: electron transfer flavoprotein subunit alpha/FixB family protein [Janthinobacterium lividum]
MRDIYALVFPDSKDPASVNAPIAAARAIARSLGGRAHAIVAAVADSHDSATPPPLTEDFASVWTISAVDSAQPLQPQQYTQMLAHTLLEHAIPWSDDSIFVVRPDAACEEIAARLACRLGGTALGRCEDLVLQAEQLHARKQAFGGRLATDLACGQGPYFAVVRAGEHDAPTAPASTGASTPALHRLTDTMPLAARYDVVLTATGERAANVEGARLVVSGGRGMGGEAGFQLLQRLADALGGALGSSLPAVDAGWAPVSRQIGQSGKYVSPAIYLAVGISGTLQHLAGIDPHTRIAAINKDADADIFKSAEIGVVADWQEFLPELIKACAAA